MYFTKSESLSTRNLNKCIDPKYIILKIHRITNKTTYWNGDIFVEKTEPYEKYDERKKAQQLLSTFTDDDFYFHTISVHIELKKKVRHVIPHITE